ncbi:hypothetical protein [Desulfothermus okinawensis]
MTEMDKAARAAFDALFSPRSVAVVGASAFLTTPCLTQVLINLG